MFTDLGPQSATDSAPTLYFYHPDHLGSTAMVTDLDGRITQNVVYIPYGEVFVEDAMVIGTRLTFSMPRNWMRRRGCTIMGRDTWTLREQGG